MSTALRPLRPLPLLALLFIGGVCQPTLFAGDPRVEDIKLPPGFHISIYAENVTNARGMSVGPDGTVYVGSRGEGSVYALQDLDGNGTAETKHILATGLNMPVGLAWHQGDLYISSVDQIVKLPNIAEHLTDPPAPVTVYDKYPSEKHHGWKYIAFGPDGKLYVPVGAPCNICLSEDSIFATITRIDSDGTGREIIAHGVRNTVGFDWHPETGELWFTDNGRDMMGDDVPDCELNRLAVEGSHFGYPFCHAPDVADPKFGEQRKCSEFTKEAAVLGPHTAPLGMRFYTGSQFPEKYRNAIFIAQHGSWNRSTPIGYRVMVAFPQPDGTATTEIFAEGWLQGNKAWGRPVDVLVAPDGSLLVSDDAADMIYRISYTGK